MTVTGPVVGRAQTDVTSPLDIRAAALAREDTAGDLTHIALCLVAGATWAPATIRNLPVALACSG